MSDIFREVDEDIRQEKYRRLWDRFGSWIIAAAVLVVVGTGGYRGWLYWQEQQSQQSGDTFYEAVRLSEAGNYTEAEQLFSELQDASGGYPAIARLRRAGTLAESGDEAAALAAFEAVHRDTSVDPALRNIAALRAAYLAVDNEGYEAIADRVEGLTGADNPFRAAARELLALSAWKAGDIDAARKWLKELEDDQATPSDVTRRIDLLAQVIRASHGEVAAPAEGTAQ